MIYTTVTPALFQNYGIGNWDLLLGHVTGPNFIADSVMVLSTMVMLVVVFSILLLADCI